MYRINSISKQMVDLQVVQNDTYKAVKLLPGNFVFSDKVTEQLKNLQNQRCIRIHEVPGKTAGTATTAEKTVANGITNTEATKAPKLSGTTVKPTAATTDTKESSTSSK